MGFLLLLAAAVFNMTKSYGSKKISGRVAGFAETVDISLCRNILCTVIGAAIIACTSPMGFVLPTKGLIICFVAGLAVGLNYVVWVLALKSGVYLFANATNTASFIIAVFAGVAFFNEELTPAKVLAILLILAALAFMGKYQTRTRGKITPKHLILLFLVFVSQGVSSVSQKWFTREFPEIPAHTYTLYSLLVSVVILAIFTLFIPNKPQIKTRVKSLKSFLPWVALMAVCFYATTFFQLAASARLDAVVMYPVYNGLLLLAGNLMAWFCFGEKPNRNSVIGAILVFSAILLIGF